jgi:hypothetical protein
MTEYYELMKKSNILFIFKALFFLILGSQFSVGTSYAAYYNTLPKGVRAIDYRNITTTRVNSSFNDLNVETPYSYAVDINANTLSNIPIINEQLLEIKYISAEAYNSFSVGEYGIEADANVNVQSFGLGWGITNRLTAYFGIPFYQTEVDVRYKRIKGNNHRQTAELLAAANNVTQSDVDGLITNLIENLESFDINSQFLQSIVTNELDYNPIGRWQGSDYGDLELGAIYRITNENTWGLSATVGAVLPTGFVEDPNVIQDISFGDGQTDAFLEFGGGVIISNTLVLNGSGRYTYQAMGSRAMRVPEDADFALGETVSNFDFKLGDKLDLNFNAEYMYNSWLEFKVGYEYAWKGKSTYYSEFDNANEILALNSETVAHNVRLGAKITSVNLFKQKKFLLPGSINFSVLKMLSGRNIPVVSRYELQFRMFF